MCLQGDPKKAVDALESYVALCSEQTCLSPEGRAFCTLAECQQALGDMTSAMLSLETFLEMTQQNDAEVSLLQDQEPENSCLRVAEEGLLGFLLGDSCISGQHQMSGVNLTNALTGLAGDQENVSMASGVLQVCLEKDQENSLRLPAGMRPAMLLTGAAEQP